MWIIKIIKLNAFILLEYLRNTDDASFLVYNYRPEGTGFNMYAENTQQQLTFLTLLPWFGVFFSSVFYFFNYFIPGLRSRCLVWRNPVLSALFYKTRTFTNSLYPSYQFPDSRDDAQSEEDFSCQKFWVEAFFEASSLYPIIYNASSAS